MAAEAARDASRTPDQQPHAADALSLLAQKEQEVSSLRDSALRQLETGVRQGCALLTR